MTQPVESGCRRSRGLADVLGENYRASSVILMPSRRSGLFRSDQRLLG
jgi:hypothetical protein